MKESELNKVLNKIKDLLIFSFFRCERVVRHTDLRITQLPMEIFGNNQHLEFLIVLVYIIQNVMNSY